MNCPKCGKEMKSGYVSAAGCPVIWTPRERKYSRLAEEEEIPLCGFSFGKGVPAGLCEACRKVVVDY